MSKPTIVCVPGAWLPPEIYAKTLSILKEQHGYPTIGLPLHSVGASPPDTSFDADVKGVRNCLTKLVVEEEKEVVLVVHSISGLVAGEAPVGLGKKDREAANKQGGVIRLVFINAYVAPEAFLPTARGAQFPDWIKVDMEHGVVTVTPEDAKRVLFNDLFSGEGDLQVFKLSHQSLGVYTSTTSYAAWRYIPSTHVIGTEDKTVFTPEFINSMIDAARKIEPTAFDVVEQINAGHCVMINRPEWLANVLRRAAGESL